MGKTILITGGNNISAILNRKLKSAGQQIIFLSESADGTEKKETGRPEQIVWNRRSPLSARNAVLTVKNSCGTLDEAYITYSPEKFNKTFHEISTPVYDLQIDRWLKGHGYLIRELMQLFLKQGYGRINLVFTTGGAKVLSPVDSAVYSFLKTLGKDLSVLYQNENAEIRCFESDSDKEDEFADFIFKNLESSKKTPGKFSRFSDKRTLFDFGR